MTNRIVTRRIASGATTLAAAGSLWMLTGIPTGFPMSDLAVFAGPGIVLAIAMSWTYHGFARDQWTWSRALHAAIAGAVFYPPLVALAVAWSGTLGPSVMVFLFVMTSWCALGAGAVGAVARWVMERRQDAAAPASPPHLDLVRD